MSTWTSGHITEPKKTLKKTQLMRVWQKVSLWKVRSRDKGDKVHAADLKYCHMQKQAGFFLSNTPVETGASVAFFIVS